MSEAITVTVPFAKEPLEFVRVALGSLIRQEFRDWNGVLLDDSLDGSDAVRKLVESYGDSRLRYIRHDGPRGIGNAWNACMNLARSEFYCILHTDDILEPAYLGEMLALANAHPEASTYFCSVTIVNEHGKPCFSLPDLVKEIIAPKGEPMILRGAGGVRSLTVGDFILAPTMLYRASQIRDRRFSSEHRMVLDLRFLLELLYDGGTIVGTHRRLYRYRRHGAQQTARLSASGQRFQEEFEVFQEIARESVQRDWNTVSLWARARPIFRLNALYWRKFKYVVS